MGKLFVLLASALLLAGCAQSNASVATPVSDVPGLSAPMVRTRSSGCTSQGGLPDPACTPGAADPRVTQATIASTICTRGYTATVRPPLSVTEQIKRQEMAAYGMTGQRLGDYELDHLLSRAEMIVSST